MPRNSRSNSTKLKSAHRRKAEVTPVSGEQGTAKGAGFWVSKTVEELAREQGVKPIDNPNDLKGDFWPENESVEDFLLWLRALRREGKEKR